MFSRIAFISIFFLMLVSFSASTFAGSDIQRTYTPSPGEIIIYNADLAQLTQDFTVAGNEAFRVELPSALLPNTLRVKVDGKEVDGFELEVDTPEGTSYSYTANYFNYNPYYSSSSQPQVDSYGLEWDNSGLDGSQVELSYLAHGISWEPRYTCDILDDETSHFHYSATIDNRLIDLEGCNIKLLSGVIAGVDQDDWNNMNNSQTAGMLYNAMSGGSYGGSNEQFTLNVHEIYDVGKMDLESGKLTCLTLFDGELEFTRHLVWDAREAAWSNYQDQNKPGRVKVIYKLMNETQMPFAAGTVAMYEDDIFIGMDPMELTPVGSPGHITMGESMDFRVFRYQKDERMSDPPPGVPSNYDDMHTVTLEIRYFGKEPATLEILDKYRHYHTTIYRQEGEEILQDDRYDNILKFEISVKPGDKLTKVYVYYTP